MTTTPAGWYDDGQGALRWWDGTEWTNHVHAAEPGARDAAATDAPTTADGSPESTEQSSATEPGIIDLTAEEGRGAASDPPSSDATSDEQDMDPAVALGFAEPWTAKAPSYEVYRVPGAELANSTYPGGYTAHPGAAVGATPQSGSLTATEDPPKKRSLWWIWAVAGAVLLILLVVLAVIVIPALMQTVAGPPAITDDDEDLAKAVVQDYDRAWQSGDCDLMFATTTENWRDFADLDDCSTFEEAATLNAAEVTDYTVIIKSIDNQAEFGVIYIETDETYNSRFDAEGNDLGTEQTFTDEFIYTLVLTDTGWLIDDASPED